MFTHIPIIFLLILLPVLCFASEYNPPPIFMQLPQLSRAKLNPCINYYCVHTYTAYIYKCNSDAFEKSLLDKTWLHDESFMNVAFKPHIKNLVQKELKSLETFFKTVCRSMCIGWEGVGGSRKKFILL